MRKSAEALAPVFDLVPLDFSAAPPVDRKASEAKKKEKPTKPTESSASPTSVRPAADSVPADKEESSKVKSAKKKEKHGAAAEKDGKKKAADNAKATSAATEDAGPPIPSMIDLRVGHIVEGTSAHQFTHCIISQSSS